MIILQTEGIEEIESYLESLIARLESDDLWAPTLGGTIGEALRYARSISPVDTGSYQAAHRVVVDGKQAMLSIDPGARNIRTGAPVEDYAGYVEARDHVYARTAVMFPRIIQQGSMRLLQELTR